MSREPNQILLCAGYGPWAVTKKLIHEDSGGVTTLCGAVEACLGQGLRRRALGLFKTNSTTALLHKIAKRYTKVVYIAETIKSALTTPLGIFVISCATTRGLASSEFPSLASAAAAFVSYAISIYEADKCLFLNRFLGCL
ncbi:Small G protein signaling modulator 1 [Eumeta japonica]|uniref:Small G protein signaling modulator 1 n=1 Tax=Eumeta variegata TaxID=151549 RepID=A0A4C1ULP0_EUMVA|nr:Small G protein signaling modulator 1 [Eumeta japonica]